MAELNLILLGPPGAGKGTQAARLTEDFGLPHIATGDILRAAVAAQSGLGKEAKRFMDAGELVPDNVITGVILERIKQDDARDGFVLDGFPRTVDQADALASAITETGRRLTAAFLITVPDEVVVKRLGGRRISKSGRVYHVDFDPPKVAGKDDEDGSELIQRDDDKEQTIRKRLAVYHKQTAPLIAYYEDRGLLWPVDGTLGPSEVHEHIRAAISTVAREEEL
jgi:adenylate kinase